MICGAVVSAMIGRVIPRSIVVPRSASMIPRARRSCLAVARCVSSRLDVFPKGLGRRQEDQVVLDVRDRQEVPKVHWSPLSGV